jgi:hypothetical protein
MPLACHSHRPMQRRFLSFLPAAGLPLKALLVLTALCSAVRAEEGQKTAVSWEVNAGVSGIGRSRFEGWSTSSDARILDTTFNAVASIEAKSGLIYRLGLDFQRHDFGEIQTVPLPGALQSYSLVLGADLQLGDAWLARIELRPGFYGDSDVFRFGAFNVPIVVGASYFASADLQFVLGVSLDFNRKYPVLPGVGVRWRMGRSWVLDAILPTPRIEYSLNTSVTLYAGADFRGDSYRVSRDFGRTHDSTRLDDAVGDYTQIRVGTGFTWNVNQSVSFQMEAGFVPVQDLDYHRADLRMHSTEIPPYLDFSLKTKF